MAVPQNKKQDSVNYLIGKKMRLKLGFLLRSVASLGHIVMFTVEQEV